MSSSLSIILDVEKILKTRTGVDLLVRALPYESKPDFFIFYLKEKERCLLLPGSIVTLPYFRLKVGSIKSVRYLPMHGR